AGAEPFAGDGHVDGTDVALGRHGHRVGAVERAGDDRVGGRALAGDHAHGIDGHLVARLHDVALGAVLAADIARARLHDRVGLGVDALLDRLDPGAALEAHLDVP